MKVEECFEAIDVLCSDPFTPLSSLSGGFQQFIQKKQVEQHRRAAAGGSVLSVLSEEIQKLRSEENDYKSKKSSQVNNRNTRSSKDGTSEEERKNERLFNENSSVMKGCQSSYELLYRNASCLAFVLVWLETQYAVGSMRDSDGANSATCHEELDQLFDELMNLVLYNLNILYSLNKNEKTLFSMTEEEYMQCDLEPFSQHAATAKANDSGKASSDTRKWYEEHAAYSIRIAMLLPVLILRLSGLSERENKWAKAVKGTKPPAEFLAKSRALQIFIKSCAGVSYFEDKALYSSFCLSYSDLRKSHNLMISQEGTSINWNGDNVLRLSSHEDLLLLRKSNEDSSGRFFSYSSRGNGNFNLDGHSVPYPPLAYSCHFFPNYCSTAAEEWPVRGVFAKFLRSLVLDLAKRKNDDDLEICLDTLNPLYAEWYCFLFPSSSMKPAQTSTTDSDEYEEFFSNVILHIARIASKISPVEALGIDQRPPPPMIPRAILLAFILSHQQMPHSDRKLSHYPLKSGSLTLVVDACFDLISVTYQFERQTEYILAMLTSLEHSSTAVLTHMATWLFPKLMQIFNVVTDGSPKYFISRCVQVLVAALPSSKPQLGDTSLIKFKSSHELLLLSCRELHLHPSEWRTESILLSLQPFISLCPIGPLVSQVQPLTEMVGAVISANIPAVMEIAGEVLSNGEGNEAKQSFLSTLLRQRSKSIRIVMYCLRIACLLCNRCPLQAKAQAQFLILPALQAYLLLLPLPLMLKSEPDKLALSPIILSEPSSEKEYCQSLWLFVTLTCKVLKAVCHSEWRVIMDELVQRGELLSKDRI